MGRRYSGRRRDAAYRSESLFGRRRSLLVRFYYYGNMEYFLNYGDTLLLQKYYPVMQKWLGYVDKYTVNGLLKRWPDTDYRNWYLGDWATPAGSIKRQKLLSIL